MKAEDWPGQIVSFYLDPASFDRGVLIPGKRAICGTVIGTFDVEPFGKGKIPDLGFLVQGRSGKKVRISNVANHVERHKTYKEADAACEDRNSPPVLPSDE